MDSCISLPQPIKAKHPKTGNNVTVIGVEFDGMQYRLIVLEEDDGFLFPDKLENVKLVGGGDAR